MSASFVLDCSITMTWCFPDEATPASSRVQDRLAEETALVPAHWFLEVANVLVMAEKRRRIAPAVSEKFLDLLGTMDIEVDHEAPVRAFEALLPMCRRYGLTSYDAAYLDLAARRRVPLSTLDSNLRSAARRAGIGLLGK